MKEKCKSVYLSLGGNLGNPSQNLQKALIEIAKIPPVKMIGISNYYWTSPVGNANQPDFINLVCHLSTSLEPKDLLAQLQVIEKGIGKTPKPKFAPRLIDIDILFYEDLCFNDIELQIPHPRWKERLFVLIPLLELTSCVVIKDSQTIQNFSVKDLIASLGHSNQKVVKVDPHKH